MQSISIILWFIRLKVMMCLKRFYPRRIAKPAIEIREQHREKEAREKAEREERKRVVDEALKQYEQQKGGTV